MNNFEYAAPRTELEVLELLSSERDHTEILAGGTDLIGLMKKFVVTPKRVVSLKQVDSLKAIEADSQGMRIGAMVTLEDFVDHPVSKLYPAVRQAVKGINTIQLQAQGTIGGELCQRPRCWYFRNGDGLLANRGLRVSEGDNRYHAILGNSGPAKFVSPSRVAPALIALGARVRIIGPGSGDETVMSVEDFFVTPKNDRQREHALEPGQFVAQIILPAPDGRRSANYEVQTGTGWDYPLTAAAAGIEMSGPYVASARIVLGHVAPTPWISREAGAYLLGKEITPATAEAAGEAALSVATPLSMNEYKVHLAKVAVERAVLLAAGLSHGGFQS